MILNQISETLFISLLMFSPLETKFACADITRPIPYDKISIARINMGKTRLPLVFSDLPLLEFISDRC